MTVTRPRAPNYPNFEPRGHTAVGIYWNGTKQWGWDLVGRPTRCMDKAFADLKFRARMRLLADGAWEARTECGLRRELKVK